MSPFSIFSRHPHGDISAHADGELAPDRREALDAHLEACERCGTELDELLSVRSALRGLPSSPAPRSFALTPAMTEREPTPVTSRATPSFVAMRVAGAGFAAVLAVVVMLDAGGIVDDSGGSSDESAATLSDGATSNRDALAGDTFSEFAEPPEVLDGDPPGNLAGGDDGGDDTGEPAAGGVGGLNGYEDAQDGDAGAPALDPETDDTAQEPGDVTVTADDSNDLDDSSQKAAGPESGDGAPAALTSEDGGVSSLLLIEIGLAVIAVLAIGGSFLIRRPAESERD